MNAGVEVFEDLEGVQQRVGQVREEICGRVGEMFA